MPTITPSQSSANVSGIYSEVNLITGDMVTLIDSEFNDPNNPTLEFHKTQVENSRQIVLSKGLISKVYGEPARCES